jgi:cytochrome P450
MFPGQLEIWQNDSELAFNTPRAFEDIYGHRIGRVNMNKDPIHVGAVEAIPGATNLTMADEADHPRQRRALAHAFSQKALMEQEHILQGYVSKFIVNLRRLAREKTPANMVSWFNFCTFDIIGDLSFGEPFGCLEEGEWEFSIQRSRVNHNIYQARVESPQIG